MDLATFKRQAKRLPVDISVFVRGAHGVGKTEIIYQLAEEFKLPVMQRRLSQLSEGDLIGLPHKTEKTSDFLPMKWFVECMEKPYLIFFDEIDRALPEVIQSVFELCYDRTIQGKSVHKNCRIYAAGNSGTSNNKSIYQVNILDPAFLSRFWIADVEPTIDEWLVWAKINNIDNNIIDFIKDNPDHLEIKKTETYKPQYIYPSRRNWVRFDRTLKGCKEKLNRTEIINLASGFVGFHAAQAFSAFGENQISADEILNHFNDVCMKIKSASIEKQNKMINRLYEHAKQNLWTSKQIQNLIKFLNLIPDELKITIHDKLTSLDVLQENSAKYISASRDMIMKVIK